MTRSTTSPPASSPRAPATPAPPDAGALAGEVGLDPSSPLLATALTHSSYAAEHGLASNERLEFLGDAVVDLAVADLLVTRYPDLDQGAATLVRARVVNEASLARAAERLGLAEHVRLGRGEIKKGGRERPALLADAFEALVAALFLERGFAAASGFVAARLGADIAEAAATPREVDPKARLTQWAQERAMASPVYTVSGEGPSHARRFTARVRVDGRVRGEGEGTSKKAAEAAAALDALEVLDA
ncbi:MAG TPA: ribonuclease III [Acidimicrobiales bacterium]|nr:ribonuclease III [Acidimicrobiales bacterium]